MRSAQRRATAVLTEPDGSPAEPDDLEVAAVALAPDAIAAARAAARHHGLVLERDGLAVLGLGTAAHLALPAGLAAPGAARAAADLLAALPVAPYASTPPTTAATAATATALGALPFDRAAPARLTVPACTVRVRAPGGGDGPAVAVLVGHKGEAGTLAGRLDRDGPGVLADLATRGAGAVSACGKAPDATGTDGPGLPERFELSSPTTHRAFRRLVADAVAAIGEGRLDKVVLAREVDVAADRPFRQDDLLGRLRALHPSCAAFAVDGFVGASPELLCRRDGRRVTSVPLAGTVARSGDPDEDARLAAALRASAKDRAEHGLVVRAIVAALEGHCDTVEAAATPTVLELRNVAHLATTVSGELSPAEGARRLPSALELAAALHPTPAVGGWPVPAALAYLAAHEGLERDRYAGPVGYLDAEGDGEFWVGIRSALVEGRTARLLAGVGIVAGSDPDAELAETQLKLQALLAVAVRP